jgi:hypothetical protein
MCLYVRNTRVMIFYVSMCDAPPFCFLEKFPINWIWFLRASKRTFKFIYVFAFRYQMN